MTDEFKINPEPFPYPTDEELKGIGRSVLNLVSICATLGHTNPAHSLDYIHDRTPLFEIAVAHDLVAWVSGRKSLDASGCGDRLVEYVQKSGWQRRHLEQAAAVMFPPEAAS